jgi:hypothetical protein
MVSKVAHGTGRVQLKVACEFWYLFLQDYSATPFFGLVPKAFHEMKKSEYFNIIMVFNMPKERDQRIDVVLNFSSYNIRRNPCGTQFVISSTV